MYYNVMTYCKQFQSVGNVCSERRREADRLRRNVVVFNRNSVLGNGKVRQRIVQNRTFQWGGVPPLFRVPESDTFHQRTLQIPKSAKHEKSVPRVHVHEIAEVEENYMYVFVAFLAYFQKYLKFSKKHDFL